MFFTIFKDISLIFVELCLEKFGKIVKDQPFVTFIRVRSNTNAMNCNHWKNLHVKDISYCLNYFSLCFSCWWITILHTSWTCTYIPKPQKHSRKKVSWLLFLKANENTYLLWTFLPNLDLEIMYRFRNESTINFSSFYHISLLFASSQIWSFFFLFSKNYMPEIRYGYNLADCRVINNLWWLIFWTLGFPDGVLSNCLCTPGRNEKFLSIVVATKCSKPGTLWITLHGIW